MSQKTTKNMSQNNTLHFSLKISQSAPAPAKHGVRRVHFQSISGGHLKKLIPPTIPPLRLLQLPSLRVLFEALLSAAPLGGPYAVAFAPLGYAVRFRLGSNAHAFLPIQKLTTHYATLIMNPWYAVPIIRGSEMQIYQARNCIGSSIENPLDHWNSPMRVKIRAF